MQPWEYQTLVLKLSRDNSVEVIRVNDKEAKTLEPGGFMRAPVYRDLPSYLVEAGRDGWDVAGMSPATTQIPTSSVGEGKSRLFSS